MKDLVLIHYSFTIVKSIDKYENTNKFTKKLNMNITYQKPILIICYKDFIFGKVKLFERDIQVILF